MSFLPADRPKAVSEPRRAPLGIAVGDERHDQGREPARRLDRQPRVLGGDPRALLVLLEERGRLVLYCFRHAKNPDELMQGLERCRDLIAEVCAAPNGAAALKAVWQYILFIHGAPPEVVLPGLAAVTPDPIKEELMTAGEVLIERGRKQGEQRALLTVLAARFGSIPPAVVAQVNAAEQAQVDAWLPRAGTASTLDEVFMTS